jgi:phenylpropionate dioxygenase-like ring-hydroxylating dioxygenase large terminal subunit
MQAIRLMPADTIHLRYLALTVLRTQVHEGHIYVWCDNDPASPRHWPIRYRLVVTPGAES